MQTSGKSAWQPTATPMMHMSALLAAADPTPKWLGACTCQGAWIALQLMSVMGAGTALEQNKKDRLN